MDTIDPTIKNLVSAIGRAETGDNKEKAYGMRGKSGEIGRYQFMPSTWKQWAKESLGDENAEMSVENQNKVAYDKVKQWKDQGMTPAMIASKWNSGSEHKYKQNWRGVNSKGVAYDTPAYALKVSQYYNELKGQNVGHTPQPIQQFPEPEPKKPSLGQELLGRVEQGTTGVKESLAGKQNIASGVLQAGGAIAGGIGDIVGKGISALIPDFIEKPAMGLLEKGVGALANTSGGQKVTGAIAKFSQEHPEASANIGAALNIASAIPILKGVGLAKNLAMDAASLALKRQAEKIAIRDFTEVASKTIGGRNALTKNPQAMQTLIKERAIPDIVDNKYSIAQARTKLSQQIKHIDDTKLQPELDKAIGPGGVSTSFYPMEQVEKNALEIARNELKDPAPIKAYFERLRLKYGATPNIAQLNKAKRIVSKNISEAGFNSPTYSTDKIVRSALQQSVEEGAEALGLQNVALINQEMAQLIKAQDMLKYLDGKSVKSGLVGETIKNTATVGGEVAGNFTGVPLAGAFVGRSLGGSVGKKLTGGVEGILKRTGKDAERVTKKEIKRKVKGLGIGLATQKATSQKKDTRPK